MEFRATTAGDAAAVNHLLDRCFGADRHQRTAYRLRHGASPIIGPTMVVTEAGRLIASVQYWPVALIGDGGDAHPLTLLGPIGVDPDERGRAIGVALMRRSLARADALELPPVVLIGDLDYYVRFGFDARATQGWRLPGPVDQRRVLLRNPDGVALPAAARLLARADAFHGAPSV